MKLKHGVRCGLILLWMVLPMPLAQAHAVLVFSNPGVDAHLSVMPSVATVEFDGNLIVIGGAKTNVLTVQDSSGRQIDSRNPKVAGPILTVGINGGQTDGLFTVSWRVVSNDGHPVEGSYQFSVGKVTAIPTAKPITLHAGHSENFFVHHKIHLLLGFGAVVAIGIWAGFERARRKSE